MKGDSAATPTVTRAEPGAKPGTEPGRAGRLRSLLSVRSRPAKGRFTYIDGLRGVASLAVVFFHLNLAVEQASPNWAPRLLQEAFALGWSGVQVFFVLSGFVIAYSIRKAHIDPGFFGRFALRRMLRLDPPYLASIALTIGLTVLSIRLFPALHKELPSWQQLLAHLFYLQDLLQLGNIVDIYWTLCLELQFYLILVVLVGVIKRSAAAKGRSDWTATPWFRVLVPLLFVLSLLQYFDHIELSPPGLFLPYWFYFMLGASAWWSIGNELPARQFLAACALVVVFFVADWIAHGFDFGPLAALVTAVTIFLGGRRNLLHLWLGGRFWQYLGAISYSLYLIHPIIGWRAVSLYKELLGPELGRAAAAAGFVFGTAVSLIATHVFFCLVERPSHGFSRRVPADGARKGRQP